MLLCFCFFSSGFCYICSKSNYQPCAGCLYRKKIWRQCSCGISYICGSVRFVIYLNCCSWVPTRAGAAGLLGSTYLLGASWSFCCEHRVIEWLSIECQKQFCAYFGFALLHLVIGQKIRHYFLNQSEVNQRQWQLSHMRFPPLAPTTCICFKFWLVHWIVCVSFDWPK